MHAFGLLSRLPLSPRSHNGVDCGTIPSRNALAGNEAENSKDEDILRVEYSFRFALRVRGNLLLWYFLKFVLENVGYLYGKKNN